MQHGAVYLHGSPLLKHPETHLVAKPSVVKVKLLGVLINCFNIRFYIIIYHHVIEFSVHDCTIWL